ncbi:MAG: preprotein translocase subunit SecE [Crocinitomicaceae bacterium]|nr:preprotein translocase subunit SecE [Crocinitomicaceae bacterium]
MAKFISYINETVEELVHRVSWPTWKELQNNTIIVVITSIIIALAIFVMDFVTGIVPTDGGSFWKGVLGFIYGGF